MYSERKHKKRMRLLYGIILVLIDLLVVLPFVYMIICAFMEENYSSVLTLKRIQESVFSFKNFIDVLTISNYDRYIINSMIIAAIAVVMSVILSTMAAYAFAKKKFVGRGVLHKVYALTLMIPGVILTVPLYIVVKKLGLGGTYFGIAIPSFSGAFGTMLMYSFMCGIPNELLESAEMDGCGEIGKFMHIVLPLVKSAMLSVAIFAVITSWGQLLWPQIIAPKLDKSTITVAIARMTGGERLSNFGYIMAASTIGFIPPLILYAFLQKQFIESIAMSGTKG